ncbi:related to cell division control protein CDC4 [Serendipita indica DSM 11827]|uniref:Related to cell division control protein CDC4 n=1 Tax=Serendipita indica (strain DSM 11827) TaxID=1109443 RepID=G4T5V2_SERID|nr:related to cell division control protein CDC4 [Serendipita indica DSM 11827]
MSANTGLEGPSLLLAPSVRTEVVTTTTVTTTTYAPITLPALPPPPVPADPKQYPLLTARLPRRLQEFSLVFPDGAQATFRNAPVIPSLASHGKDASGDSPSRDDADADHGQESEEPVAGSGWKMLRKDEIPPGEEVDILTAVERFNRLRKRDDAMDGVELATTPSRHHPATGVAVAAPGGHGTDKRVQNGLRAQINPDFVNMRGPSGSTTSAAAPPSPLPSPTGSPAPLSFSSPRPQYASHHLPTPASAPLNPAVDHYSSPPPSTHSASVLDSRTSSMISTTNTDAAPLQPDIQLTTLLTLPSLLTHFTLLPPNLQSHVLLTLMRQAPLPVLRNIHSVLSPAMSRDFLTQLPAELVSIILSFLPGRTLARCTRVSKAWMSIIDSDPILWRELLRSSGSWFGGGPERAFARTLMNRRSVRSGVRPNYAHGHRRQLLSSPSASSASSSTISNTPAITPSPSLELPHPYKILFKSRQLTRTQWAQNQHPKHVSFAAHGSSVVTCLLFSHNRIISASDDHSIHVYNPLTGQLVKSLEGHGGGVWALAATKDTLVSGSTDRTVRIWDLEKGRCTHVFGGHKSTVRCLAIVKPELLDMTEDNGTNDADEENNVVRRERWPKRTLIVTGSRDHTLRVWKLPKAHEPPFFFMQEEEGPDQVEVADNNPYHVRLLSGHGSAVRALAARGRTLVSGSYDHTVRVWDIITGVCKWVLSGHTQKVYSIVLDHARNQACSGSMDSSVRIWSLATGQCVHVLTGHTSLVGLLGLSHSFLVSAAADSTLRVWDPSTGDLLHTLAAHTGAITCFQHDEFKILSGSDGTLKMWDIRDGTNVRDLLTGITGVWQVVFDGRWCVAASNRHDATYLDVWDFGEGVVGDGEEEWVGEGSVDGEEGDSEAEEDVDVVPTYARDNTAMDQDDNDDEDDDDDHEHIVDSSDNGRDSSPRPADGDEDMMDHDDQEDDEDDHHDVDHEISIQSHRKAQFTSPPPPGYPAPVMEYSPSPTRRNPSREGTSSRSKLKEVVASSSSGASASRHEGDVADWEFGEGATAATASGSLSGGTPREFAAGLSPGGALFSPSYHGFPGPSTGPLGFGSGFASNPNLAASSGSFATTPTSAFAAGPLAFGSVSPAGAGPATSSIFASGGGSSRAAARSSPSGEGGVSPSNGSAPVSTGAVSSLGGLNLNVTPTGPPRHGIPPPIGHWSGGSSSASSVSSSHGLGSGAGGVIVGHSVRSGGPGRPEDTPSRPSRMRRK